MGRIWQSPRFMMPLNTSGVCWSTSCKWQLVATTNTHLPHFKINGINANSCSRSMWASVSRSPSQAHIMGKTQPSLGPAASKWSQHIGIYCWQMEKPFIRQVPVSPYAKRMRLRLPQRAKLISPQKYPGARKWRCHGVRQMEVREECQRRPHYLRTHGSAGDTRSMSNTKSNRNRLTSSSIRELLKGKNSLHS